LEEVKGLVGADGTRLADALAATLADQPDLPLRPDGGPAAYLEAHIEQGPRLETAGAPIGVVTGVQGIRWFELELTGQEAHAGTTPRSHRRDALLAALDVVAALRAAFRDEEDVLRFTVGRFECHPGSPNTVPGRVAFTIDLRHPDAAVLAERGDAIEDLARAAAGPCAVAVRESMRSEPVTFDPAVVDRVEAAARRLGLAHLRLPSGAGHDAMNLAPLCPTGMVFVPCEGGLSHNEAERARPADLAAGARVLAAVLGELAGG
jgi:N-carbamoyl-L-amino-acid hydrolase